MYNVKPEINNVLQDHIQSLLLCFDKKTLKSKKVVYAWPLTKNQTSDIWVVKSLFNKCSEALVNRIKDRLLRKPIESCYIYWVSVEKDVNIKSYLSNLKNFDNKTFF